MVTPAPLAAGYSPHRATRDLVGLLVLKGYRFESADDDGRATVVHPQRGARITVVADMEDPTRIKWATIDNMPITVRGAIAVLRAEVADETPAIVACRLTMRQREVLRMLADGLTQAQIARACDINPPVVSTHVKRILRKTGCATSAEAVTLAHRNRWI